MLRHWPKISESSHFSGRRTRAALDDPEDFNPAHLMRGLHLLPKCEGKREWRRTQDYWAEKRFPAIDLDDPAFVYEVRCRARPRT